MYVYAVDERKEKKKNELFAYNLHSIMMYSECQKLHPWRRRRQEKEKELFFHELSKIFYVLKYPAIAAK